MMRIEQGVVSSLAHVPSSPYADLNGHNHASTQDQTTQQFAQAFGRPKLPVDDQWYDRRSPPNGQLWSAVIHG
jgi:hypothetical protein